MDKSGVTTNNSAYTGSVCMSITVVGNTTNLPLSDPFCNTDKCLAFKIAHVESQTAVSYYRQFDYGHYTIWYCLAVLGMGMLANIARIYRNRRPPTDPAVGSAKSSLLHMPLALFRAVKYRSVGGVVASRFGMTGIGMLAFLLVSWLFFLLLTFWEHPYYRVRRGYGSPPLGVRTGLMSTALTPVIVALSGKVNIITWLTGCSHERLNILHRWASYLCLFLAVVHTVPFLYIAVDRCGPDGLRAQFYKPNAYEYTGVPPLGILVGLCVLSVPWVRHRFYNLFYRIHIPMYVVYLGLMFWHANDEQDSWAYLWAALAIWLASALLRLFSKWQTFHVHRAWFSGMPATLKELPGGMTQVSVFAPRALRWTAGQHCYLRMPHISWLQNHPYTISNLPGDSSSSRDDAHEMRFYVRAQRGLTRDLLNSVPYQKGRALSVHVDGPYGGLSENFSMLYQCLVFVAGGSGISACLPHMLQAARVMQEGKSMAKRLWLVWMVRHPSHTKWALDQLEEARTLMVSGTLQVDIYVTDAEVTMADAKIEGGAGTSSQGEEGAEQHPHDRAPPAAVESSLFNLATVRNCKPFLPKLLPASLGERRVCVFGCGPQSLLLDLGNATAKAQSKVLNREADVIVLHTEKFGW